MGSGEGLEIRRGLTVEVVVWGFLGGGERGIGELLGVWEIRREWFGIGDKGVSFCVDLGVFM